MSIVMPPTSGSADGALLDEELQRRPPVRRAVAGRAGLGDLDRAAPGKRLLVALAEVGGGFLRPELASVFPNRSVASVPNCRAQASLPKT